MIYFNEPPITSNGELYISECVKSGRTSGDGPFTKKCSILLEKITKAKTLLTTSCTDALEIAADLIDISSGDEIIVPSYTFVSTVMPFVTRGASIVFADSSSYTPHISESFENYITKKQKQ